VINGVSVEEKRCNDEEDDAEAPEPPFGASRGEPFRRRKFRDGPRRFFSRYPWLDMNGSRRGLNWPLAPRARMIEGLLYLKNGMLEPGHSGFKVEVGYRSH
jgi:hypothetical protein